MADAASVTFTATILPDEIAKTLSGSITVTPADANDKWYYKLTAVSDSSVDLIAGNYLGYTAIATGTGMTAVASGDKVKFLYVQNTHASTDVYIVGNAAASTSAAGNIYIPAGESVALRLPNSTVADLHAITSTGSATCIVAALLDDVA